MEELTPLIYEELRRLAHFQMNHERAGHLLQTTALVHEAYLRLVGLELEWRDRAHFFKVASRQMRRVLVDHARKRSAAKRGPGNELPLDALTITPQAASSEPAYEVLVLHEALSALAEVDSRKTQVVELKFFGGLTIDEIVQVLEISHATVERDLKMAKAWLRREMSANAL